MKELLKPYISTSQNINHLRDSVIKMGQYLKNRYPDIQLDYIGGPITADGPANIKRNLILLGSVAEIIHMSEGVFTYTNPYVGDLRRFPGLSESDFILYSAQLLESGIFDRLTLVEGWERSVGSNDEYRRAIAIGIQIRTYPLDKMALSTNAI